MSDLNPTTPATSSTPDSTPSASNELAELKNTCTQLQNEAFNLRLILLVVVGALTLFFWREAGYYKFEAMLMQPQVIQANQTLDALQKQGGSFDKSIQVFQNVVSRLSEYGRTHPEYAQLLAKYGVVLNPAGVPAPAPAAPAKK